MRGRVCLFFWALIASPLGADQFCDDLGALIVATRSSEPVSYSIAAHTVDCTRARELGGKVSVQCAFGFDYRSNDANEVFTAALADVADCAVPLRTDDPDVSHPDSYDLRQFTFGGATISVARKDKVTLAQTYVFLRVSAAGL